MGADAQQHLEVQFVIGLSVSRGIVAVVLESEPRKLRGVEFHGSGGPPRPISEVLLVPGQQEFLLEEVQDVVADSEPESLPLVKRLTQGGPAILFSVRGTKVNRRRPPVRSRR